MKKKLGIIGGMGSQAGVWLLKRITELCDAKSDQDYLEVVLHNNAQIPDRTEAILHRGESPVPEILRSVRLMSQNQIDVIVMACMTAYYYYNDIVKNAPAEIIHPISVLIDELIENPAYRYKTKLGLIGSSGLLKSKLVHNLLEPLGYEVITLNDREQQQYFMTPIYQSVKLGEVNAEIRQSFMHQFNILNARGAEIILGACSEVPLIVNNHLDIPNYIDVFELLAKKVVKHCYSELLCDINTDY